MILVFGTLALIIGFLIIGLRVERSIRLLHMTMSPGTRRNDGSHQLVGGCLSSNQRRRFCRASHLRANSDVLWYGYWRWPLLPDRWAAGPSADGPTIPVWRSTERPALSSAARPASLSAAVSAATAPPTILRILARHSIRNSRERRSATISATISSCWRSATISGQRGPAASLPAAVSTAAGSAKPPPHYPPQQPPAGGQGGNNQ